MNEEFIIEPLAAGHDRRSFDSEAAALDRYLRERSTQDMRRRLANCYVAISATGQVAGFYTLSAIGVSLSELPREVTARLPRYPTVPAALIGRLAVDRRYRGRGLGAALLADAAMRASRAEPAIHAMLVEAINEPAAEFYRRHGFRPLASNPLSLFLPLASARAI